MLGLLQVEVDHEALLGREAALNDGKPQLRSLKHVLEATCLLLKGPLCDDFVEYEEVKGIFPLLVELRKLLLIFSDLVEEQGAG